MSKLSRRLLLGGLVALFAVALAVGPAAAGDAVTVTGTIACGHCTLKKADLEKCQDVLVVEQDGKKVEYYVAANEVMTKFGHVCKGEKKVKATGTVAEKDGKKWLTLTAIEEAKA